MSEQSQPFKTAEQFPTEVKTFTSSILQRFLKIRKLKVKSFLQDIITFFSIVCAYKYVQLTYEHESALEKWTSIQFSNTRTEAFLLLIFAVYMISLKIVYQITHSYETAPPKKFIPQNWEEMEQTQTPPQSIIDPNQEKILPPDSFTLLLDQLLTNSIYGFVFISCTTSYTFISIFNKKSHLVNIEQVNYLIFWFVTANIFYSVGKILGKLTNIRTFHHFGFMVGIFVILMEIGLAHGLNTFILI